MQLKALYLNLKKTKLVINFSDEKGLRRSFIILCSLALIGLIVWNAFIFFQRLKQDERSKMNIWASAQISFIQEDENTDMDLILTIINGNTSIPTILVDENQEIRDAINIPQEYSGSKQKLKKYLEKIKIENEPIEMNIGGEVMQHLYYGNSPLLNKLKYFPLVLIVLILLALAVLYFFYTTTRSSEQNKLWAGMAKETAHQIGTPLSSLIGWTELLKQEEVNPVYITEMEKDVDRLRTITERFSKIGSSPTLAPADIVEETQKTFDYLQARSSKLIEFHLELPEKVIQVNLNKQLYSWTIENLVKNSIDAMRGKGELHIVLLETNGNVRIRLRDSGKGVPRNKFKQIFEPGYTTKRRGWGLGLSLAKRIVEKYHKGKIRVLSSIVGKETTIEMVLKKLNSEELQDQP